MLQGAIIGLVVGTIIAIVQLSKSRNQQKGLLWALETGGPAAARRQLDSAVGPRREIPLNKLLDQRARMASLALIGDVDAIQQEIAMHTGKLTAVVQVDSIGLLGLVVRSEDPAPHVHALAELADRMERDGGSMMKLVKAKTRTMANLAAAIAGEPTTPEVLDEGRTLAKRDQGTPKLLLQHAVALAIEATGGDASDLRAELRAVTRAFDAVPPAASA